MKSCIRIGRRVLVIMNIDIDWPMFPRLLFVCWWEIALENLSPNFPIYDRLECFFAGSMGTMRPCDQARQSVRWTKKKVATIGTIFLILWNSDIPLIAIIVGRKWLKFLASDLNYLLDHWRREVGHNRLSHVCYLVSSSLRCFLKKNQINVKSTKIGQNGT